MFGNTAFTILANPKKLVSKCAFASSIEVSSRPPVRAYPAQFTRASIRPAFSIRAETHEFTD
jgi:hypothetical protein